MNRLETDYARHLEYRQLVGEVPWFAYEAVKLRLADKTFLTVDFALILKDGTFELHETKGFMEEDANVKLKVAAAQYPFVFRLVRRTRYGQWNITEL